MVEFSESGLNFRFEEDKCFYIEQSNNYKRICGRGVCSVESIYLGKKNKVFLIEAKSSIPNGNGIEDFCIQIYNKNVHSVLMLASAIWNGRSEEIGEKLCKQILNSPKFICTLIVKDAKEDWCNSLQDLLRIKLRELTAIFGAEIIVINEERARLIGLVI